MNSLLEGFPHRRRRDGVLPCRESGKEPRALGNHCEDLVARGIGNPDIDVAEVIPSFEREDKLEVVLCAHCLECFPFIEANAAA